MLYDIDVIFGYEDWIRLDGCCENNGVCEDKNWIYKGLWWFRWLYNDHLYDLDDLDGCGMGSDQPSML